MTAQFISADGEVFEKVQNTPSSPCISSHAQFFFIPLVHIPFLIFTPPPLHLYSSPRSSSFFHISLSHLLFLLNPSLSVLLNILLHHLIIILLRLFPPRRLRCARRAIHCTTSSSPPSHPTDCTTDGARTVSKPLRHACMNA
jgi:hypothetical protein